MSTPPPAWHPDPSDPNQLRWWDGSQWTSHTQPLTPNLEQPTPATPPQQTLSGQATIVSGDDSRPPATLGYAILTGLATTIVTAIAIFIIAAITFFLLFALAGEALKNGDGLPGLALMLALIAFPAIVALSVYLSGLISAKMFDRRNFFYRSRWNLVAAYPLASIAAGLVSAILAIVLAAVFGQGQENELPPLIGLVAAVVQIVIYFTLLGQMLVWTSNWGKTVAQVLVIIYLVVSIIASVIMTLIIGSLLALFSGLVGMAENNKSEKTYRPSQTVSYLTESSTIPAIKYRVSFKMPEGDAELKVNYQESDSSATPGQSVANSVTWQAGGVSSFGFSIGSPGECYRGEDIKAAVRSGGSFSENDVLIAEGAESNGNYWVAARPSGNNKTEDIYFRVANNKVVTGTGLNKQYCGIKIPTQGFGPTKAKQVAQTVILAKQP